MSEKRTGNSAKSCFLALGGMASLLLIIPILMLSLELILWALGGILIIADPLRESDAVVVLSGGGDLSRLEEGALIYMDHYASWLILTETGQTLPGQESLYTTYLRQEAVKLGVPDERIIATGGHAYSTYDEATHTLALMRDKDIHSCIVVTEPYHSLRTRFIFQKVFRGTGLKVIVRPVRGHWYRSGSWWATADGRDATISEYVKLFGFFLGLNSGLMN